MNKDIRAYNKALSAEDAAIAVLHSNINFLRVF